MERSQVCRWLNTLLFFCGVGLVLTGTLQHWILPRGSGGQGLLWLGLSRHEWGDLHSYLALAATIGVSIHLWLHLGWIKAFLFGVGPKDLRGWVLAGLAGGMMLAAVALPFWLPTTQDGAASGPGQGQGQGRGHGWHARR